MRYTTTSNTTKSVCSYIGWSFNMSPIETAVRKDIIFVKGTLLKPNEVDELQKINGVKIDGKTCKLHKDWLK